MLKSARGPIVASISVASCLMLAKLMPAQPAPPQRQDNQQSQTQLTNKVSIIEEDGKRIIESNGIPDHVMGKFPNRHNPNTAREQNYHFQMPINPAKNDKPTPCEWGLFGVAINGVVFDPGTAEFFNGDRESGWRYEAIGSSIDLGLDA